jgi:hypothetical protein
MSRSTATTVADTAVSTGAPFGFSVPVGVAAVAVACLCAGPMAPTPDARLWFPAAAVATVAYLCRDWRAALTVAGVAFLFVDGFLENRFGELSWHPGDGDRLAVLLAAAAVGAAAGAVGSAVERRRERADHLREIEVWANTGDTTMPQCPRELPGRPGGAS